MNYSELIAEIAERTGYADAAVKNVLNELRLVFKAQLVAPGDSINFYKFGVFKVKQRAARKVTSPFLGVTTTGPKIGIVPEHLSVKFRLSRHMREALNP